MTATGWRDIKDAPRDGTYVLVATADEFLYPTSNFRPKRVFSAYFQAQANDWVLEGQWAKDDQPTHWMPLPPPPEDKPDG